MPDDLATIDKYLGQLNRLIEILPREPVLDILKQLRQVKNEKRRIFVFGNGGSAATASHMVCDLIKNTVKPDRSRLKVIGLADNVPTISAYANDEGYEYVFAQPLESLGEAGDLAIAISASGDSPNVLRGVETARRKGLVTIGLTGIGGGKLKDLVDICLVVPSDSMEQVEDMHVIIGHLLTITLRSD